mmetsp:Transcript_8414/g.19606  ORF Transcript_8414/g.19606 Transcript_8414/m.19606 type:complete len:298 (-) Transcript_8414:253-1146(-)
MGSSAARRARRAEKFGHEAPEKAADAGAAAPESKRKRSNSDAGAKDATDEPEKASHKRPRGETEDEDGDGAEGYNQNLVFIGQLPYSVTSDQIKEHFQRHGVYDIKSLRLLTNKKTGRSRGMAFMELGNSKQLVLALRAHHSKMFGRMINVERTCGGGGNNDRRKEKLQHLREMQNVKVNKEVRAKVEELLAANPGSAVTVQDFDDRAIETLGTFPRDAMESIVTEFMGADRLEDVENRSAWLMGIIKKYRERLKDGNNLAPDERRHGSGGRGGGGGRGGSRFGGGGGGRGRGRGRW